MKLKHWNILTIARYYHEMRHFLRRLSEFAVWLPEYFSRKGHIYVYISSPYYKKTNSNWGDDLNRTLVEFVSGKKVVHARCQLIPKQYYLCIGSVLQWFSSNRAIVWGAGLIAPAKVEKCNRIFAVRGPLTRAELLKQGIECPEVYGDPALLMPRYYQPKIEKKYIIGVICHYSELQVIKKIWEERVNDFHFIDIQNYGKWSDFIDEICSCDYILSSSLHGCIISDAYEIPNLWCRFFGGNGGGDFKFVDYYLSVGKKIEKPQMIDNVDIDISSIIKLIEFTWKPNRIDLNKLMAACPFARDDKK